MCCNCWKYSGSVSRILLCGTPLRPWKSIHKSFIQSCAERVWSKAEHEQCRRQMSWQRPPYDVVMMFKILVLQRLYNLSDDQTEYQINDRMSFMRFLGINLCEKVPDAKTIWKFKNDLAETETVDKLFCMFDEHLENKGLISHKGTIVDATFVDAPRQRNSRDENKKIKNGVIPE